MTISEQRLLYYYAGFMHAAFWMQVEGENNSRELIKKWLDMITSGDVEMNNLARVQIKGKLDELIEKGANGMTLTVKSRLEYNGKIFEVTRDVQEEVD